TCVLPIYGCSLLHKDRASVAAGCVDQDGCSFFRKKSEATRIKLRLLLKIVRACRSRAGGSANTLRIRSIGQFEQFFIRSSFGFRFEMGPNFPHWAHKDDLSS